MNIRKAFIIFYFLFGFASVGFGQERTSDKNPDGMKRFLISVSAGNVPLPGTNTSILPGAEVYILTRVSLYGEIALLTGKKSLDSTAVDKKYFRYKAEIRYYLSKNEPVVKPFIGMQYTNATRSFNVNKTDIYYEQNQIDSIFIYDRAHVNSPVQTFTFQAGTAIRIRKNIYGDIAAGCGFRVINTDYSELVNWRKERRVGFLFIKPISSYRYTGSMTRSQFNLNFRISYRF